MAEHKHAAVLRAIADKGIESVEYLGVSGRWLVSYGNMNPITCPEREWRIKPEPKPDVVRYWPVNTTGGLRTLEEAREYFPGAMYIIKLTFDGETDKCRAEVLP